VCYTGSARRLFHFLFLTVFFGLRICVLTHATELTLVFAFPFSGRTSYSRSSLSIL